ncbi:type I secretion protein TolC [Solimonas sp. K1W22B-7]|uniref:TolC family outer membrane protein n=1 Tax=Solimonas sp. K1W22B-7 TaxID=2303331 RepID=UPI000E335EFC|nr:TolC family outer membrane protein [Solimonas sp. K1W22B-7]AXQ28781.1 type I secretion protein TolC [Solimonas sp. K1W22B-7]
MRLTALLLSAALALPCAAQANELLKIYDLALQNDATWRAAEHARDASVEAKPQARALLLPQVTGSAAKGRTLSEVENDPAVGDTTTTKSNDDPWSYTLSLNQPIFDWGAIQQLRQADDVVALAETSYRSVGQDLLLRVAQAYFNVLAATDTLSSARDENKAVSRQLELAQARFEVGLSAITEVQEAQARYDLTNATVIQSQQVLNTAYSALAEITGRPYEPQARLVDELPLSTPIPSDIEAWVKTAREGNLDVLSARLAADIADTGIGIARAGHYPTLDLNGSHGVSGSSNDASGVSVASDREITSDRVTLQLTLPIFSGLATQSRVREATSTREQRRAEYTGAQRFAERQTRDAYFGVLSGSARVAALKQAVVSSVTALDAARSGQEVGTRTFIDVLNAQQQLSAAQRDYYRSRYDYLLAGLLLRQAAGNLGAADLEAVDRLLTTP